MKRGYGMSEWLDDYPAFATWFEDHLNSSAFDVMEVFPRASYKDARDWMYRYFRFGKPKP